MLKGEFRIEFEYEDPAQIDPITRKLGELADETTSIHITRLVVGRELSAGGYLRDVKRGETR